MTPNTGPFDANMVSDRFATYVIDQPRRGDAGRSTVEATIKPMPDPRARPAWSPRFSTLLARVVPHDDRGIAAGSAAPGRTRRHESHEGLVRPAQALQRIEPDRAWSRLVPPTMKLPWSSTTSARPPAPREAAAADASRLAARRVGSAKRSVRSIGPPVASLKSRGT